MLLSSGAGLMACLAWNFIAITAAWFQGQGMSTTNLYG